jgi:hypothetical protein
MATFSRRTKVIVAFVAVILVGYGLVLFWQSQNHVPVAFSNARAQGAVIAENIVNISKQSNSTLDQINIDDRNGNYSDALSLVSGLVAQSEDLRTQAVSLSNQVQQMTQSLSEINSFEARQAALEAISSHLALINQLITYSGDLGNLSNLLQARFAGEWVPSGNIQASVNQINTDVNAINNFNEQAGQAMQKFDKIAGK